MSYILSFAKAFKKARKEKGLSQEDLAKQLGLSRVSIANYETGKQMPMLGQALHISKLLTFSLDGLRDETSVSRGDVQKVLKRERINHKIALYESRLEKLKAQK